MSYRDLTPNYDPNIITLVDSSDEQWGDPEVNRENLIPYGIPQIDRALYGMDITNGELNLIIAPEKQRKTTMVLNIVANFMTHRQPEIKPLTVIDTLESGMRPETIKDSFLAIVASRYLIRKGHSPVGNCRACGEGKACKELMLSPKFLRYNKRSTEQLAAIEHAMKVVREWPVLLYGASITQGLTRDLVKAKERWIQIIEETGAKIFVTDHVQQYNLPGVMAPTDYEKQIQAVAAHADIVSQYNIVELMISQISIRSQTEARSGGKIKASGGAKVHQEANTIFGAKYDSEDGHMTISIEDSRHARTFAVYQPLEPVSGTFYGKATSSEDEIGQPGDDGGQLSF